MLKKHRLSTRPKNVDCEYCLYASESIADKPHYPAPLGTPKWVLRLMNLHRYYQHGTFYNGEGIPSCLTCKTIGGERMNWPCETLLTVVHGINGTEETSNKEQELRALGVIATGKNMI